MPKERDAGYPKNPESETFPFYCHQHTIFYSHFSLIIVNNWLIAKPSFVFV
jgi:hypothetical protein